MDQLPALIKAVTEKSSLLFGAVIGAVVLLFADLQGLIRTESRLWLYCLYYLGVVSFAALSWGLSGTIFVRASNLARTLNKLRLRRKYGLKNFEQLSDGHKLCLRYIKDLGTPRFLANGRNNVIQEMERLHLIAHDDVGPGYWWQHERTYFRVPNGIWAAMHQPNWGHRIPVAANPPWYRERI